MIIVRFFGGLGNQMFQYGLYTALKKTGKTVRADYTWYETRNLPEMPKVLRTDIEFASSKDIQKLGDYRQDILSKVHRKLFGICKTHYYEPQYGHFDEHVLEMENAYIDGYWQSEKYFSRYRADLQKAFQLTNPLDSKNKEMLERIRNSNSVSVHFRLGDYMAEGNTGLYGDVCTKEYYASAIRYFLDQNKEYTFFIFSNEPKKVMEQFEGVHCMVVDINDDEAGHYDMFLMSQCKHNIIANSSFSWWAAWLNENEDKEVIAPDVWFTTEDVRDIWPKTWKKVDKNGKFVESSL